MAVLKNRRTSSAGHFQRLESYLMVRYHTMYEPHWTRPRGSRKEDIAGLIAESNKMLKYSWKCGMNPKCVQEWNGEAR